MFVLKLPLFFTLLCDGKRAAISKLTYIWTPSSFSYIALALGLLRFGNEGKYYILECLRIDRNFE